MKTVQFSNKKSFRKKIFSARSLFIIYILLPLLIVGIGFSAWSTITPYIGETFSSNITSEKVIDTSALMNIDKFEPYTKQLYYTGPIGSDGKIQNELHIDVGIGLKMANLYTVAQDCGKKTLYLSLTLSLTTGAESSIFYDVANGTTNFGTAFTSTSKASEVVGKNTTLTISKSTVQPDPTSSSVTLLLLVEFSETTETEPFAESDKMTISPEFILDADGYGTFFDLALDNSSFRLDLRLSENSPI